MFRSAVARLFSVALLVGRRRRGAQLFVLCQNKSFPPYLGFRNLQNSFSPYSDLKNREIPLQMSVTLPTIITTFVALFLGWALTAWLFARKDSTWPKRIGISLLAAILGFLLARTTETWLDTKEVLQTSKSYANEVRTMHTYLVGIDRARHLAESPFRILVERELDDLDDRLVQIGNGELRLKREEIIPRWETLIRASKKHIDATNIVTQKDWVEFSRNSGIEVHEEAIKKHVGIRRIMIYDEKDSDHETGLQRLCEPQTKLGIELRKIPVQWIFKSSFLSELLRDLGTVDVVIYDSNTVLLTTVDDQKRMLSAKVNTNPHLARKAEEFFDKLWISSQPINP
jgi:hypothetical protein